MLCFLVKVSVDSCLPVQFELLLPRLISKDCRLRFIELITHLLICRVWAFTILMLDMLTLRIAATYLCAIIRAHTLNVQVAAAPARKSRRAISSSMIVVGVDADDAHWQCLFGYVRKPLTVKLLMNIPPSLLILFIQIQDYLSIATHLLINVAQNSHGLPVSLSIAFSISVPVWFCIPLHRLNA